MALREKEKGERKKLFEGHKGSLIFSFHQINKAMFRLANKTIDASSLPIKMQQLPVFMTLYYFKEQSQQEIANRIHRDKSSVLRTASALEKKGLLTYKKDNTDKRKKLLTLTEVGNFVALQIIDLITEIEDKIATALTDRPKEELIEMLEIVSEKLELLTNS